MNPPTVSHSPIADRAKAMLGDRRLNRVVDSRLEAGVATYGQPIDAWSGSKRRAAVMRLQELLDAINYALFEGDTMAAQADAAQVRRILLRYPDLAVEEMVAREPEVEAGPTEAEQLRKIMDDAMNLWREIGNPMLLAAAKELQQGLDGLKPAEARP
ncbi:hypothetical protein [Deinococcus sp. QL22]|uniref:hypothetical protein n=1 Tax=Deinococcus sp. QL22 TaxID=2939437 RepID=UPI002017786B|nr:hypothetical protein [Deinococcus sp. QL22]UQN10309.1 hypothetical protein M1R55_29600 [Deinococcus sp. QL22]UQN10443.1 hypothetical protein M1R55_28925 [Deinococcus sp. QL22]